MTKKSFAATALTFAVMSQFAVIDGQAKGRKHQTTKTDATSTTSERSAYQHYIQERKNNETAKIMNSNPGRVNVAPQLGINLNGLLNNGRFNGTGGGWNAGAIVNIGLGRNNVFAFQPGIIYVRKYVEMPEVVNGTGEVTITSRAREVRSYGEVPMNLVFKFGDVLGAPRYMVGAGPYISYLVYRNDRVNEETASKAGDVLSTRNYKASATSDVYNLNYGIGGFVGMQMRKGFYFKAGTELGLREVAQGRVNDKGYNRNYAVLVSVGYMIGSKYKVY